jgi:pimeloyl-[acyl-carrier protein] methyl ester esterase
MALEIVAVLDTARVTSGIHVVASSFGALPALELWRLRPAALLSLTLAGGLPRFTSAKDYPAGLDAARIERLGAQLAGDRAMVLDMFFRSLFTRAERERPAYAGVKALRAAGPLPSFAGLAGTLDLLEGTDLRALFSDVRAPVQFITGDADPICPLSVIEPLRALQPMLRVDVMKGCGHFPFLSHPEEFNTVVRGFTG